MKRLFKTPVRGVIYSSDIQNMTGVKHKSAQKLLTKIRKHLNKPQRAYVTIQEFCWFTKLQEEFVREFLD